MLKIRNRKPIAPGARKLRLAKTIATLFTLERSSSIQSEKQMSYEVTTRSGSRVVAIAAICETRASPVGLSMVLKVKVLLHAVYPSYALAVNHF